MFIPIAGWSKAGVCGRSLADFEGSILPSSPVAWMFVSCECCVLSGRGLCDGPIPRPEESYRCGVSGCHRKGLIMRRPWPTGAVATWYKDKPMVNQTNNINTSPRPSTQIIVYSMQSCWILAHESFSSSQDIFCFLETCIFISVLSESAFWLYSEPDDSNPFL